MSSHSSVEVGKVLGLNTPVKVGLRVQLTDKGKAGFDEQLNELAGPDGRGWITTLMNDGLICAVRWDKNPDEEHFYRTGKFERYVDYFGMICIKIVEAVKNLRCLLLKHLSTKCLI